MTVLIRIKLPILVQLRLVSLCDTKLNDLLLPSLSPQIKMNKFLSKNISLRCSLTRICSLMAHMPSVTGYLSHILFSRLARVFYNILSQLWTQEMTQIKIPNCLSSRQHVDPSLDSSISSTEHLCQIQL